MKPTIAVIGAGPDRRKFANKCVRAFLRAGYDVFPVHPAADTVEGLPVYRSIVEVPVERLDCASVYLPPSVGVKAMEEIARKPVGFVWLNPGADGDEVVRKAEELGVPVRCECSIVAIGLSPSMFTDA
jgi:predicted CoA-binding protein